MHNTSNSFHGFHFLFTLNFIVHMLIPSFYFSLYRFQKLCIIMQNFLSMNLNLKMAVKRSKRRSYFLLLVFITKCHIHIGPLLCGTTSSLCFLFFIFFIFKKQVTKLYHFLVRKDFCHILFDSWALRHHLQVTSFVNDTSAHYREKNKANTDFLGCQLNQ